MSVISDPISSGLAQPETPPHGDNYLNHSKGIMSWLLTVDHKRIGVMYMVVVLGAFFLGGVFAILVRTELLAQGPTMPVAITCSASCKQLATTPSMPTKP